LVTHKIFRTLRLEGLLPGGVILARVKTREEVDALIDEDPFFKEGIADWLARNAKFSGTNFHCLFQTANRPYERIIILSAMQAWIGHYSPVTMFEAYKRKYKADPRIFSFDLQRYGTLQFPERNIYCLAGFSDKTMETLKYLDSDKQALIREIEAVEL